MRLAETRMLRRRNPLELIGEWFLEHALPIMGLLALMAVPTVAMLWLVGAGSH